MNPYQVAWQIFRIKIEDKTSWGRNDLKDLMLDCLLDARGVLARMGLEEIIPSPSERISSPAVGSTRDG